MVPAKANNIHIIIFIIIIKVLSAALQTKVSQPKGADSRTKQILHFNFIN
jgi:hypothetical protein